MLQNGKQQGSITPRHRSIANKVITVRTSVKSDRVRVTIMRDPDSETIEYLLPIIFSDNIKDNKVIKVTADEGSGMNSDPEYHDVNDKTAVSKDTEGSPIVVSESQEDSSMNSDPEYHDINDETAVSRDTEESSIVVSGSQDEEVSDD